MRKGTTLWKFPACSKYNDYMMLYVAQSTARGYISALNSPIVSETLSTITTVGNVFEITDPKVVLELIHIISKSDINKCSHSRYTAALHSYHRFLSKE